MKAEFVLDSSVALAWCFSDERTPPTDRLLDRMKTTSAAVPSWWYVEMTNVLAMAERRGRIRSEQLGEYLTLLQSLDLEVDEEGFRRAFDQLLPLCRNHALTAYDAVYLDLAMRRGLPLATLDQSLRAACTAVHIELLGK